MGHIYTRRKHEDKFEKTFEYFMRHPLMKSAMEKLQAYRDSRNGKEVKITDMYYVKEIYDSYLCNKL